MKKKLFSLCMDTAITVTGAVSVSAVDVGKTLNARVPHEFTADFWQSIACHEMGHAIGLTHNRTSGRIMNPNYKEFYDSGKYTIPQNEHIADLVALYSQFE